MTAPLSGTTVAAVCSLDRCDGKAVLQVIHPGQGRPVFACVIHRPLAEQVVRMLTRTFHLRLLITDVSGR